MLLVCLPANATHILQPLGVAVFSPFKGKLKRLIGGFVEEDKNGGYSIDKATAMQLAGMAWRQCNISKNIASGFSSCGLFPLLFPKMEKRLSHYQNNGAPEEIKMAAWLEGKPATQIQILTLLTPPKKMP